MRVQGQCVAESNLTVMIFERKTGGEMNAVENVKL